MFRFDREKIDSIKEIGRGRYGSVYAYRYYPNDDRFVVKIMSTKKVEHLLQYIQEIVLMFSFDHPNVMYAAGFDFYFENDESWVIYIKLPRMFGTLQSRISQQKKTGDHFSEIDVAKYFHDLVCGLQYLHDQGVVHSDIKPDNILIDKEGQLRITDFNISKVVSDESLGGFTQMGGSLNYSAPEIRFNKQLLRKDSFRADLWSLGRVILDICLLGKDINGSSTSDQIDEDLTQKIKRLEGKYSKFLLELISNLLKSSPSERKSLAKVKDILEDNYRFLRKVKPTVSKETQTDFHMETREQIQSVNNNIQANIFGEIQPIEDTKSAEPELSAEEVIQIKRKIEEGFKIITEMTKSLEIAPSKGYYVTDNMLTYLMETPKIKEIANSQEIEELKINLFSHLDITDKGVIQLARGIESNFKSIQKLQINFYACIQITDIGVEEFGQHLSNLKNIQELTLLFGGPKNNKTLPDISMTQNNIYFSKFTNLFQ